MEDFYSKYINIINELEKVNDITYIKELNYVKKLASTNECLFPLEFFYPYSFCHDLISNKNIFGESKNTGYLDGNSNNSFKDTDGYSYILFKEHKIYLNGELDDNLYPYFGCYVEMHDKSPHNYEKYLHYLKYKIHQNKQNIIVDCGSSEGIFEVLVASNYDISNILFVCIDPVFEWNHPLEKTLTELGANYIIINEFINNENTLENILEKNNLDPNNVICIKADIEGFEFDLINRFTNYLNNNPLCIICTYHNQDDALNLYNIFINYYKNIEFSKGYLLPLLGELKYPYFRKGLIITY